MAVNRVSSKVLDAVYARLSNVSTGFNPRFVVQAPLYGIPTTYINIDWTSASKNFVYGQIDPSMIEQTGDVKYPFSCLYIQESGFTGDQKFTQFSGLIRCIFEIHLSWQSSRGIQNNESYANCVEDVVFDCMNRENNQDWGKPLVYNGTIQCRRGPLVWAAQNFKQRVGFSMLFGLHE